MSKLLDKIFDENVFFWILLFSLIPFLFGFISSTQYSTINADESFKTQWLSYYDGNYDLTTDNAIDLFQQYALFNNELNDRQIVNFFKNLVKNEYPSKSFVRSYGILYPHAIYEDLIMKLTIKYSNNNDTDINFMLFKLQFSILPPSKIYETFSKKEMALIVKLIHGYNSFNITREYLNNKAKKFISNIDPHENRQITLFLLDSHKVNANNIKWFYNQYTNNIGIWINKKIIDDHYQKLFNITIKK